MLSKSGLEIGIALPQSVRGGAIDLALVREYAQQAEAAGFDDLWTIEQITGSLPILESLTLISYLAAITQRIRFGTAVLVTNLRNPVQLAKALSSLDHLSAGRLTVGIGLGVGTRVYPAYGVGEDRRVARFIEGIKVMRALWTEDAATFQGDFFRLDGVPMQPKPVQKPNLPLWFGAHTEAAQQRAVRYGDGWIGAGSTDLDEFFVELARIKAMLAAAGRDAATFPLSKRVYLSVDEDEAKARERIEALLHDFYGLTEPRAEAWAVYGSAAHCTETLLRMRDAGLTHVMLHPAPADLRHLKLIATQIAPNL